MISGTPESVGDKGVDAPMHTVKQSRVWSLVESWVNVGVGFGVNFAANLLVLPHFGLHVRPSQAFGLGVVFTAISVTRSYLLRRWFVSLGPRRG